MGVCAGVHVHVMLPFSEIRAHGCVDASVTVSLALAIDWNAWICCHNVYTYIALRNTHTLTHTHARDLPPASPPAAPLQSSVNSSCEEEEEEEEESE